ncbi:hypothetical protein CDAR_271291 [Caerostris darwini]|uniref:Uncharacterized protein n=1 Tax=Caerostris darwini TaxID=1538125 RepID=A0AAV4TBJ7_9ARAC|nr:hypothetical protein CDAR_271291 [Caerostris darwini]
MEVLPDLIIHFQNPPRESSFFTDGRISLPQEVKNMYACSQLQAAGNSQQGGTAVVSPGPPFDLQSVLQLCLPGLHPKWVQDHKKSASRKKPSGLIGDTPEGSSSHPHGFAY